jgi:hypothetical protein
MADARATTNAAGEVDADLVFKALKNLEEKLAAEKAKYDRKFEKFGDKMSDLEKSRMLDAGYRYQYVSDELGPESPAKIDAIRKAQ